MNEHSTEMFTGIVETVGTVTGATSVSGGKHLRVNAGPTAQQCLPGASVSVSGVCLTISSVAGELLEFDVIPETLGNSTLGSKRIGDRVNLERAMRLEDRFDGHFVQGHVDGTGVVDRIRSSAREWLTWIRPENHLTPYIIPKGSIAVDGVSLTVAEVRPGAFCVALIPTTLVRTTLADLVVGDQVNLESDIIARAIVHRLTQVAAGGGLTLETLRKTGFAS